MIGMPDLRASYDYFRDFPRMLPSGKTWLERRYLDAVRAFFRRTQILPPYGQLTDTTDCLSSLMGGTPQKVPELYHLGSPINHVGPHCPPTLLLQGAHDSAGMVPDMRRLYRALRQAGVPSVYVEFPDTEHAFDLIFPKWAPVAQAATYDMEHFLALMG
jgi:acetyl esterase/lipase